MQKQEKLGIWYSLYGRLLSESVLERAYMKVKSANGAPGIDGESIKDFGEALQGNLGVLVGELRKKSYRPKPVKRVEIPKPNGGVRKLGIPAVRDRIVQQAVLELLTPIYDPGFHPSSYGYRPGRSCHDAIRKAELFMRRYDLGYVVDMDLSACFDTLNHDFLMRQLQKKIADGSMLKLIELFLKSGVMVGNELKEVTEGSPQGGVISPLLANIYLDYFDQWSRERGYRIVRYADDTLIFSRSHKAAVRRLKAATAVLEGEMGLRVNEQKTQVTSLGKGVEYLGVVIRTTYTTIQHKKVKQFKEKVKRLTNRSGGKPLWRVIAELNPLLRGFAHYFRIANGKGRFREFMTWIRRRLRAIQLRLWKKPRRLHRRLRQLGYSGEFLYIKMQSWASARSPLASMAMPNGWLYEQGLYNMELVFSVHR